MTNSNAHSVRNRFAVGIIVVAACLFSGCSEKSSDPLRIGINAWPGYEFLYLAQEKGFYEDEGVEVRLVEFDSLSDARRSFERGQIDGFGTTVVEVLQAREHSMRSPQIVQVLDYSNGADMILTRPGITNGAGLRGKRVGVELASLGVLMLVRGLEKHGLRLEDIQAVSADQMTMESQFLKGELDAVVTYPPTSINLLRDEKSHPLFTSAEIPGEVVDVLAFEAGVCGDRSIDVQRVIRALHKAMRYERENPTDAHAIMARREGITAAEFRDALHDGVTLIGPGAQLDYLKPGGKLAQVVDATDKALRAARQIKGPDRRQGVTTPTFARSGEMRE